MSATAAQPTVVPPTGTVTFLFSDIEGSTRLLEQLGPRFADVLRQHRQALRGAFAVQGGVERSTEGDSFFVAFPDAPKGLAAAVDASRRLASIDWPDGATVRVRVGLHTGEGRLVDGDYVGMDVHRAARIAAAGHGGQILLSESTRILAERSLPPGVSLTDLGEHRFKDIPAPEHLYQVTLDGQPGTFPPLRSLARTVSNLPAELSTIVGRDADVEAVRELLDRARLVTVTGAGGTGKTRLVQEVARLTVTSNGTDVTFVPLEALTDADLIPAEVLRALRLDIAASKEPLDRVVEHLAGRKTLLVLDNLEQLSGAGLIVRSMLDGAPALTVLASSQAALHLAGEHEYALQTLPVPDDEHAAAQDLDAIAAIPAVRLFVERARAARADFALDASNAAMVVAICRRLDGLPLAIELAAAQAKLLSPQAILNRISGHVDVLSSRRDDLPLRQRTLRATVDWSYNLLPEPEQRLFRRLAAFAGGARLSEVEAIGASEPVVPDPIDALAVLVDRSLVAVRRGPSGDDRYVLLETIRAHGRDLLRDLGEESAVLTRHAAIYRDLARQAEPEFYAPSRRAGLDRLANDHDNLRAALDYLETTADLTGALDMSADLWRFWQQRGHLLEGRERLDRLLEAAAARPDGEISPYVLSRAEEAGGSLRYWTRTEGVVANAFYERSLEHARASGDPAREAWAMYNLAFIFDFTPTAGIGEVDEIRANQLRRQALERFRELGDRRGVAESLWAMGGNALAIRRDPAEARSLLQEAEALLQALGNGYGLSWVNVSLALLDASEGKLEPALEDVLRAADVFVRDGDVTGEIVAVQALGSLAARGGDDITAIRLAAAAEAAARDIGAELPRIPPIVEPIDEAVSRASPEELRRERGVGVALGARSILASALEARRIPKS
jgi:predicted ATPase/class 3 adenylate cyclase